MQTGFFHVSVNRVLCGQDGVAPMIVIHLQMEHFNECQAVLHHAPPLSNLQETMLLSWLDWAKNFFKANFSVYSFSNFGGYVRPITSHGPHAGNFCPVPDLDMPAFGN